MIKKSKKPTNGSRDDDEPQFRDNPEINAKIDPYKSSLDLAPLFTFQHTSCNTQKRTDAIRDSRIA